jgi:hypothetical protein
MFEPFSHWATKLHETLAAGAKLVLPACEAVTVIVPGPKTVNVVPVRVAGPLTAKLTGRPEVAWATSATGPAPVAG